VRNSTWRKAILFSFSLVFALLLVSGAPRLIADSCEDSRAEINVPRVQAYLCGSPQTELHGYQAETCVNVRYAHRDEAALFCAAGTPERSTVNADANGNVLMRANYMRSVYQVFALGDGFV